MKSNFLLLLSLVLSFSAIASNTKPARTYDVAAGDHLNKVAILPFGYIRNGQSGTKEIVLKFKKTPIAFCKKHSAGILY